jgi:transposase
MTRPLVNDELWQRIEPLLPPHKRRFWGGRPPIDDRIALTGILFVLKTGIPWEDLPQEIGCCGMTCWRRLRDWQQAGVWDRLHELLLSELDRSDRLDWSRAAIDSSSVRAVGGGEKTGPNSTDRGRPGSKHHVLTDGKGVPLQVCTSAANVHELKRLLPLVVGIPRVRGKPGRPRSRPKRLYADRAYDDEGTRQLLRWLGITPYLPRKRTEHGSGLGKYRYVVERTISWLHGFRRLRVRYDRRDYIHDGFLKCATCMICFGLLL